MPKGPQGQERPADVIGSAFHIAKIATVEIEETTHAQPANFRSGKAESKVSAESRTAKQRSEIARMAAKGRWS